jgi:hypothetical protein
MFLSALTAAIIALPVFPMLTLAFFYVIGFGVVVSVTYAANLLATFL